MKRTNERTNERTSNVRANGARVKDFSAVLADLRAEREQVLVTLADLEAGIRIIEKLNGGPSAAPPVVMTAARPLAVVPLTASVNGGGDILSVIKRAGGSMRPGELAAAMHIDRVTLRRKTKPLLESGQLVAVGVTASRRLSLPGPAKEAI